MNVLQVVQHLKTGGLEKVVLDLVNKSQFAVTTTVVALEGTKEEALATFPQLRGMRVKLVCLEKRPGWQLNISTQLQGLIKDEQIDVVHSHHIGPLIYSSLALRNTSHVRHIHTIHDAWFLTTFRYRLMFKLIASLTRVELVADADAVAREVKATSGIEVPTTILNGIDTTAFKPGDQTAARITLGLPLSQKLIGCAARLEPGKGHKALLEALQGLPEDVSLVLAGDGSLRDYLRFLAAELGIEQRIFWLGSCKNMPQFYQAIDSFCLFSEREGLPLTLMEAIASNKPVVSTNVGGVAEIVSEDAGIILAADDYKSLPVALAHSLTWQTQAEKYQQTRKRIDLRTMCERYDQLFAPSNLIGEAP
ncbi:glycosyltransferase [Aestuariibacter salexigens]|uniref:glycosyltransferase n=1 Tax=Aestuariibacter salexigens TaxID=226010 RepID=UPI00040EEA46|nr:glycosyltransferase [Aestuariibacter salexigens]